MYYAECHPCNCPLESLALCTYASIKSHWKATLSHLSSKIEEEESVSKWPELTFDVFLSMNVELLHHCDRSCGDKTRWTTIFIAEHLEDLVNTVTRHCRSPATLKNLLKLCSKLSKSAVVHGRLSACLPRLLLCENPAMVGLFACVAEAATKEGDLTVENSLYRAIARKVVLFLMHHATLLKDDGKKIVVIGQELCTADFMKLVLSDRVWAKSGFCIEVVV